MASWLNELSGLVVFGVRNNLASASPTYHMRTLKTRKIQDRIVRIFHNFHKKENR
jgi:hypothetical protein